MKPRADAIERYKNDITERSKFRAVVTILEAP